MPLNKSGSEWISSFGTIKAVLSDGKLLALSIKSGAGGTKELVGQLYTEAGAVVGASFVLKSATTGSLQDIGVTALTNGRFAVAWTHNTDDFGNYRLETGVFNSNGTAFKAPVQIGTNLASSAELTPLANGGYAMTFEDRGIKSVAFDANGVAGSVQSHPSSREKAIAYLKTGGYVTILQEEDNSGLATISAHLRKADGQTSVKVLKTAPKAVEDLQVVALMNGNLAIVWSEENYPGADYIKAQIINVEGAAVGGEITLHQHATASFQGVHVEALLDGGFSLAFAQAEPQTDVYLGTYSATGTVVNAPMLVHRPSSAFQQNPSVNVLKDGRMLVGWTDYEGDRSDYYQVYDAGYVASPVTNGESPTFFDLVLLGSKGKDVLTGGIGNDRLYGLYGNDKLTGAEGADIFVFNAKLGTSKTDRKVNFDTITDFDPIKDTIWLENKVFTKLGKGSELKPGKLNSKFFKIGKAKDKNDYVLYDKKTGILSYDADGTGSKYKPIEFAKIGKNLKLSAADFFIV